MCWLSPSRSSGTTRMSSRCSAWPAFRCEPRRVRPTTRWWSSAAPSPSSIPNRSPSSSTSWRPERERCWCRRSPPRSTGPAIGAISCAARRESRVLHPLVLRRALRGRQHDRGVLRRRQVRAHRRRCARPRVKTTDALDPPATGIFTPDTEFGSRFLVEVVRGCANLCRFCWAGYNYLPVRAFPADRILELARAARAHSSAPGWSRSRSAITRRSSESSPA